MINNVISYLIGFLASLKGFILFYRRKESITSNKDKRC